MTKTTLLIAAILSAAAAPAFAQSALPQSNPAQPTEMADTAQRTVSYADLNLATPKGVAVLDGRIARAVKQVCGDADARDLGRVSEIRKCRAETQARVETARAAVLATAGSRGPVLAVLASR